MTPRPNVSYSPAARTWTLVEDFRATIDRREWFIPAGFCFDLASIPRALWSLLASHELGELAPLCHDYLYRNGGMAPTADHRGLLYYTRAEADDLFLRQMKEDGVSFHRRRAAYLAVRLFGRRSWKD